MPLVDKQHLKSQAFINGKLRFVEQYLLWPLALAVEVVNNGRLVVAVVVVSDGSNRTTS